MTYLTTKNPIRLVQITDTHLYGADEGTLLSMNTHDSLQHVLNLVQKNESNIDLILATGDIAQDASEEAYNCFIENIRSLAAPFRWIPGNHDSATVMSRMGQENNANEKVVLINGWLIVFLDSSIEGQVHGRLAPEELEFLETTLEQAQSNPEIEHCMVCLHHNPVKGSAHWMKDIGLHNSIRFFDIISRFDKIRSIVYGHIHQELDFEHNGIRCLCTPSTCVQFKPQVTEFALDKVNPGYRSFALHEDGSIDSKVHRVSGATFEADYASPGY